MKVLVDTSIWSLALRRSAPCSSEEKILVDNLHELISQDRAVMIGPIRQEILSGIPDKGQFTDLKERLQAFDDLPLVKKDYEKAAEFFNTCRSAGIQGSQIDFLICAAAVGAGLPIFTSDKDFLLYSQRLKISLLRPLEPQEKPEVKDN
jgi:predicted nucleic acid-binding protein